MVFQVVWSRTALEEFRAIKNSIAINSPSLWPLIELKMIGMGGELDAAEVVPAVVEKLAAAPAGLTSPVESFPQTGGRRHEFKVSVIEEVSQVSSQTRSGASHPSAKRFTDRAFVAA
jgi:hypothetical protein